MFRKHLKKLSILMMLMMVTPNIHKSEIQVVMAKVASPVFQISSKTLYGLNKKYTLKINNLTSGSKCYWSSSNQKVATVTGKGVVTTVAAGVANINTSVVLPDQSKVKLTCKITVKVRPATSITIYNMPKDNTIDVGDSFDYDYTITPSNTTDKIAFKIKDTSVATVDESGVVKAVKSGSTILTVSAGKVYDSVPIIVKNKTPRVDKVVLNNGSEIQFLFTEPIDASTVLEDKKLINISFTRKKDSSSVLANDYGDLTGYLSSDLKTLTIQSTNAFHGSYEVEVSDSVKTVNNISLDKYDKTLTILDTYKPILSNITFGDTGVLATINFNEPISIDKLVPAKPSRTDGVSLSTATLSYLTNRENYILSKDKKSLQIDLTDIAQVDKGKQIRIPFLGISDLSGNISNDIVVTVTTDTTIRDQAKIVITNRSSYNEITVVFDKAIRTAGTLELPTMTNSTVTGVIDKENNKLVHYTLTSNSAQLTGNQVVYIKNFSGYNTIGTGLESKTIDFTIRDTAPSLLTSSFDTTTTATGELNTLTLTFDKAVTITSTTGKLEATLYSANQDVNSIAVNYTSAIVKDKVVTLVLDNASILSAGTYEITIPSEFVRDSYYTKNIATTISIDKLVGSTSELPAPKITQSTSNPSEIILDFTKKIDKASAENISNYYIHGAAVSSAKVISNSSTGAKVKLTLLSGTITLTAEYPIAITGVKGYEDSYSAMSGTPQLVKLVENVAPTVVSTKINSDLRTIVITFNDDIKGTPSYEVYQGNTVLSYSTAIKPFIVGKTIVLTLSDVITNYNSITLRPTISNLITDSNNNSLDNNILVATY